MREIPMFMWIIAFLAGFAYSFTGVFAARITAFCWGLCVLMLVYYDKRLDAKGEKTE